MPVEGSVLAGISDLVLVVMVSAVFVGMILVIFGTISRTRWGINSEQVNCPSCNRPMPQVRTPNTLSQSLWGGGTCENCGCEMDKWGREKASH